MLKGEEKAMKISSNILVCIFCLSISVHNITSSPPPGLENLGESCYMNATLQCLNNMKEFRNFIVSNEFKPNTMVRSVADVLDKMQNDGLLKKTDGLNNAWSLVQDKVGTGQKDASEFFVTLVDTMESQLSSEKQQDIRKIVKFTLHSHTRSPEGNVLHVTPPGERGSIIIGSILQGDTVEKDIPSLIYI